jgi:UDP-N-acetylmuramate-alanine ligase
VRFWESNQELKQDIIEVLDENSVVVFMGAGDIGVKARKCLDAE